MSAALLEWMDKTLTRAQHQFGHANTEFAARQAQWEVDILKEWQHANPADDVALAAEFIHPLTLRLRRQYEYARQSQEHRLIEWKLERLDAWTQETHDLALAPNQPATPTRARPRWR